MTAVANYSEIVIDRSSKPGIFDKYKKLASKLFPANTEKSFREFVLRDTICEISDNHQSYVYKKRFVPTKEEADEATTLLIFQKDKQPYHTFPAITQLHSSSSVNRISFRIKNSISLILESRQYKDDPNTYCKLYIANAKDVNIPNEVVKSVRAKLLG
jgi:hypothetical protein